MPENPKISISIAQELVKDIRILALSGRSHFQKYLYDPLFEAGWYSASPVQNIRSAMERLKKDSLDPAFIHTIAPRCKRLISASMNEGLSPLGNSCILFLEKMQAYAEVSACNEAAEFTGIVNAPLNEFRKLSNEKSARMFTDAVNEADTDELKSAFDSIKLDNDAEKIKLDAEIKRLYDNILIASQYHNIPKCRKLLSSYIIRFSDDENYARTDVERLVTALNNREPGFEDDLKNTIAIDLYYRITQSILKGDVLTTVRAIRKYGYIFEGNPGTRYFYDIDRMERILYNMISEKGLWDSLKKKG